MNAAKDIDICKDMQDLTVNSEKNVQNGKQRKNHCGGQKKKRQNGSKSNEATSRDVKAKDAAENEISEQIYEIKATASKGLGVFATQDIRRGTRIMCERPLIHSKRQSLADIPSEFLKISSDDQGRLLSLHRQKQEELDVLRRQVLHARQGTGETPSALSVEEQLEIMAIFESNSFEADDGAILCHHASRINHSCLPNVHHSWNELLGRETVHAVQDIAAGQEILTTYTKIDQDMAVYDRYPTMSTLSSDKEALLAVIESLKLLREEGIQNMELKRNYEDAAKFSARLGDFQKAYEWQEKAVEMAAACAGTDDKGYQEEQATLRKYQSQEDARLRAKKA
ncbi:MAG: hypothetical protein Q9166_003904 [cf. Caloplaca sp. 2 TL-2023]